MKRVLTLFAGCLEPDRADGQRRRLVQDQRLDLRLDVRRQARRLLARLA